MLSQRLLIAFACALGCVGSCDGSSSSQTGGQLIARARALRAQGALTQAATLLHSQLEHFEAGERATAHGLLGRIALAQGQTVRARTELEQGMKQQQVLGAVSEALADGFALTFLEAEVTHDLTRSAIVLDRLASLVRDNAEDRAALAHHRALVAYKSDEPRRALALLSNARFEPVAQIPAPLARAMRTLHGSVLASLGRFSEARTLATEVIALSAELGPCERSDAHASRGWFALSMQLSNAPFAEPVRPEAHADFLTAREAAERCEDPRRLGHASINLALSNLLERSDVQAAERALARFDDLTLDGEADLHAWALETRGRILLSQLRFDDAHEVFTRELALAAAASSDDWAYRALIGMGRAQTAKGRDAQALAAFRNADQRVARLVTLTPVSSGHDAFYAQREEAALGMVQSLVALGRIDEAEQAARTALSRVTTQASSADRVSALTTREREQLHAHLQRYRSLRDELDRESRDDWRLSSAGLASASAHRADKQAALYSALDAAHALAMAVPTRETAPAAVKAGTLRITLYPALAGAGHDGAHLFVRDARGVRLQDIPGDTFRHDSPAGKLGALLQTDVAGAQRVELLLHPGFPLLDLHASLIAGQAWNASAQVVYAEGLPPAASTVALPATTARHALVVIDPTGTLVGTEQEGAMVQASLHAGGFEVVVRDAEHATRAQLLVDLSSVEHLHFAGHARTDLNPGLGAVLTLAGGESLSGLDILSLEHTPAQVVLSACGKSASKSANLSLARALLAQGSQEVLAATRPVDDLEAARIMEALYAELAKTSSLAEAFRRAVRRLAQQPHPPDWAAFRIFVR